MKNLFNKKYIYFTIFVIIYLLLGFIFLKFPKIFLFVDFSTLGNRIIFIIVMCIISFFLYNWYIINKFDFKDKYNYSERESIAIITFISYLIIVLSFIVSNFIYFNKC